ncbi:hypothetical protein C8R44DRAFT_741032 [Mycena epipterygia]|nr:hypothetical protein C8R44DRAFT_741032 [Mycena epipterygia]
MSCAGESDATKTMRGRTHCYASGENGTRTVDTGGNTSTSNTVKINGSAPTPFDGNIIIHGGQGGNGGDAGETGGAGGAGQGNQIQIHLLAGGDITFNVHCARGTDRDLELVVDMVVCLAWLGVATLALACLHLALVRYF